MAEEDILFGKKRHLFGGIGPSNMLGLTLTQHIQNGVPHVTISATLPRDTVIEGQTLCSVAGAIIRRSKSSYPKDEFEGEFVADITENGNIVDQITTGNGVYYYSAFPYTDQGVYNRNKLNRASIDVTSRTYLYGYDLNLADSNPVTRVSYPSDVDNANFSPFSADFTAGTVNYGGWASTAGDKFMPKPCMLKRDGTVEQYLNPDDYSLTVDGTPSLIADMSFDGNAMMQWPKIYTHREEVNGVYKFRCSDAKIADDWECWTNYDKNGQEINHFYTSIYKYSRYNNVMRSMSGRDITIKESFKNKLNDISSYGNNWCIGVLSDELLIQDLLVMMGKSTNTQAVFGAGISVDLDTSGLRKTGLSDKFGLFKCYNDIRGVKIFGMEHWWGECARSIAGYILDNGKPKVKLTYNTHDGSSVNGYNGNGTGYISIGNISLDYGSGWISGMKTFSYGRLVSTKNGSSSTYECDEYNCDDESITVLNVGGTRNYTKTSVGLFCSDARYDESSTTGIISATLSCKPSIA